jgi:predicted NUDIX family NTP pyrophosphohydrolase
MSGNSMRKMLQVQPFVPFEVHLSGGEVHQVSHPELAWVAGSEVYVYYPESDRVAWCSLLHVTSLEHSQRPQKKKGANS